MLKKRLVNYLKTSERNHYNHLAWLFFISTTFLLSNCTTNQAQRIAKQVKTDDLTVGIDEGVAEKKPQTVPEIEEHALSKIMGPVPEGVYQNEEVLKERPAVKAVVLGPGIYRGFAYLPALKELRNHGQSIHFIGGYGLSAVIATYFAFGHDPGNIEWKLYKTLRRAGNPYPFSDAWTVAISDLLEKDFKGKRLEQANIGLFIPSFDSDKQVFAFRQRGDVLQNLKANLSLNNRQAVASFLQKNFCGEEILKGMGAELVLCLSVLDESLKWSKGDDYLVGLFNRVSSLMMKNNNHIYQFKLDNIVLDSLDSQSEVLAASKGQMDAFRSWLDQQLKENKKL